MKKFVIVMVGALLSFAACGKKDSGPDMTGKMTEFKDAMCKCKAGDSACANKVLEDQKKWADGMAKSADKGAKADPEMAKKLEPITAEYGKCMTAAMTPAAAPPTPTPAPTPSAGCAAGATQVADMGFCITLPPGYTVDKQEDGVEFKPADSNLSSLWVTAPQATLADSSYDMFTNAERHDVKASGELLGGKGKWFYSSPKASKESFQWGVYVVSGDKLVSCEQAGNSDGPAVAAALEICKTITPINL